MATRLLMFFAIVIIVSGVTAPINNTENANGTTFNTDQTLYRSGNDSTSRWSVASITNKILIVVIIIIAIIAGYLVFRYYRLQRRRTKLTRYQRLQKDTQGGLEANEGEEEIVVYEKE